MSEHTETPPVAAEGAQKSDVLVHTSRILPRVDPADKCAQCDEKDAATESLIDAYEATFQRIASGRQSPSIVPQHELVSISVPIYLLNRVRCLVSDEQSLDDVMVRAVRLLLADQSQPRKRAA